MRDFYITPEEYEQAERIGVSRRRLEARIRIDGWSKKRALTTPIQKPTEYRMKMKEVAIKNGIKPSTYFNRVNNLGWDEHKAATTTVEKVNNELRRKYPLEIIEKAKRNGIGYNTLLSRIKLYGWSVEDAATVPVGTRLTGWQKKARERHESI